MTDRDGALVVVATVVLGWLLVVATMPAWDKPAVLFWTAVAMALTGGSLWLSHELGEASP